jgi:hypothetical protein
LLLELFTIKIAELLRRALLGWLVAFERADGRLEETVEVSEVDRGLVDARLERCLGFRMPVE